MGNRMNKYKSSASFEPKIIIDCFVANKSTSPPYRNSFMMNYDKVVKYLAMCCMLRETHGLCLDAAGTDSVMRRLQRLYPDAVLQASVCPHRERLTFTLLHR